MRYIDYIRNMNDGQLAYFINMLQPEIELWMLSMGRALSDSLKTVNGKDYSGPDSLYGLNGDARDLLWIMYKDYDLEKKRIEDCYNPGNHMPWDKEIHPYTGSGRGKKEE